MSTITPNTPAPQRTSGSIAHSPSTNRTIEYRDTDAVRRHANIMAGNETQAQRNALDRLNTTLQNGEPPRDDVPRGYYLDILV